MKWLQHLLGSAIWLIVACHALTSEGAITFALVSSELNPLQVGQTATVDVVVSGLESGQELDSAGASLVFDANLLSSTAIIPGGVIQNTGDFFGFTDVGLVDGSFQTFGDSSSDRLLADGVLFSFELLALAPGSGTVDFDFWFATEFTPDESFLDVSPGVSGALPFLIVAVPEPAGWQLAWVLSLGFLTALFRSRRRLAGRV